MTCVGCKSCDDDGLVSSIEFRADGLFVKQMHILKAGTRVPQHAHVYDHLTMLATGSVRVWKDGALDGDYIAPTGIMIAAGIKHTFEALEDDTVAYCIHAATGEVPIMAEHQLEGRAGMLRDAV